jgi:hypothetical protein
MQHLMSSFVIAAPALLVGEYASSLLYFWGLWKALATNWVAAWARL